MKAAISPAPAEPILLTIEEVAERCRVCTATVRIWSNEGILPKVPMIGGRGIRYLAADVLAVPEKLIARAASEKKPA